MLKNNYAKVVIIGAGFGGLTAAKNLGDSSTEVIVIDKTNHHLFQPLLYQVASAALSPAEIARPIREILRNRKNTFVLMDEVTHIDKDKKIIQISHGDTFSYDYLIIAIGTRHSYFGKDEWEGLAPGIKTLDDALLIREKILKSFEKAERENRTSEIDKYLNFVVIGGGPTGVELAGAIAEIAHKTLAKDFRRVNLQKTKVYLVEASSHILSNYPLSLSNKAKKALEDLGVEVITNKRVSQITEEGIVIDNLCIPTMNILWAAGNQALPLLSSLNTPLDKQGRAIVEHDLSLPGFSEIFVIGDAASVCLKNGKLVPGIAPAAIQEGKYVARIIRKRIPKEKRKPFTYFDKGMMATVGKARAVAVLGPIKLSGLAAWFAWSLIHVVYLIGFRNRFTVMLQWIHSYFTGARGARIITKPLGKVSQNNPSQNNT